MNPDHLIAVVFAAVIFIAFLQDYVSAGRPAPVRVRSGRRDPRLRQS